MVGRFIRIVLIVRIVTEKKHLEKASRLAVSQNKRRYEKDGFDLDLCYITGLFYVLCYPSWNFQANKSKHVLSDST